MDSPFASLYALSQAIAKTQDPEIVYTAIHQIVAQQFGESAGLAVAYYDRDAKQIHLPYVWADGQRRQAEAYALQEDSLSQVVQSSRPVLLARVADGKERFANLRFTTRTAFSLLAVPLVVLGDAFGAIAVMDYMEEGQFSETDLQFLSVVAAQVSAHEQMLRSFGPVQQDVSRYRRLYDATMKIRSSVDMQTILETTAQELGRMLDARRVRIEISLPTLLAAEQPEDTHTGE
ncbi:MAG: GAF domain-containing protein [Chloroflexota bacterium]